MSARPADLSHVDTWVFDLDNTLYPRQAPVMSQVEARMTEFIMRAHDVDAERAHLIRDEYWRDYGTTLNGLMRRDGVDVTAFLDFVHDIDHSVLEPDAALGAHLSGLEGRRYVYTNGSFRHAERTLERLGLSGHFDDLFGIEAAQYRPKPGREGFEAFGTRFGVVPRSSVMFEDCTRNLQTAAGLGYTTVLIHGGSAPAPADHVHHAADDLSAFFGGLRTVAAPRKALP